MATSSWIAGDLEPDLDIQLTEDGRPADLTGITAAVLLWTRPDQTTATVDLTIVDAPTGRVRRTWVAGDTAQVGTHRGRVRVTHANGDPQTFPGDGSRFAWQIFA